MAYASHLPHDGELLGGDEGLENDADGHVDVVLRHLPPEVHLRVGLRDADHGLHVADRDGNGARYLDHPFPSAPFPSRSLGGRTWDSLRSWA